MKKVFLSHTAVDKPFARQLASDLQSFGLPSWIDEAEIGFGESLIKKIQESIERVSFVIVIISQDSIKSNWVQTEMEMALTLELEGKKNFVVPLVIDKNSCPLILRRKKYLDCETPRQYKLNLGAFVESIRGQTKPQYLTAGQAANLLKSQCLFEGKVIGISQQGVSQVIANQHILLRHLIYRDAHMGASRYWVFELFDPHSNIIKTLTVTDGIVGMLEDKAIQGWASEEQLEKVKFYSISYVDGVEKKNERYRVTTFQPKAYAERFSDSKSVYQELLRSKEQAIKRLLGFCFVTMMYHFSTESQQFVWTVLFFDTFSTKPLYFFECNGNGIVLREGETSDDSSINKDVLWFGYDKDTKNINARVSLSLLDFVIRRNK